MAKNMNICLLMDFYGQLLTEKQLAALELYYNEDLSLGEIAEEEAISRQGVRDAIKRGEGLLNEYEEKLGLAKKFMDISRRISEMNGIIDRLGGQDESSSDEIRRLKEISVKLLEIL